MTKTKQLPIESKHLIVFGTRPEAIKMAPLIQEYNKNTTFDTKVCVTAQHREMLDQVLDFFDIQPDYDLDLMKPKQNLFTLTADIITGLKEVLEDYRPDYVYVHGDTTTSMAASLAAFYAGAKVVHIEAGLRTYNKHAPFPEEINRQLTGRLADFHMAPTLAAKENLLKEQVSKETICVTGNTVIDALFASIEKVKTYENKEIRELKKTLDFSKKLILITGHRRENQGEGFERICRALKTIALRHPEVQIVYPVHLNPKVQETVYRHLKDVPNIYLIAPLAYPAFVWLMDKAYLIITDSGGVQEEAPSIGKPVLVMRDTTERPEAVIAGTVILVGTDEKKIISETETLLNDAEKYNEMSTLHNPYGDGTACKRIVEFVERAK